MVRARPHLRHRMPRQAWRGRQWPIRQRWPPLGFPARSGHRGQRHVRGCTGLRLLRPQRWINPVSPHQSTVSTTVFFFVLFTQLSLIDISETTHYTVVKRRADNFTHWVGVVKGCYGSSLVFCGVISQVVDFHIDYTGNTAVRGSQSDSQYPRRGLTTYWAFTWSINKWYNTSIE